MDMRVKRPVAVHPMPEIAAFVAALKSAFGDAIIDDAIRRAKAGEQTFYAKENGHLVGTPSSTSQTVWKVNEVLRDRHFCMGCDGSCVGQNLSCRQRSEETLYGHVRKAKVRCNQGSTKATTSGGTPFPRITVTQRAARLRSSPG